MKIALIQHPPVFLNLAESTRLTCRLLAEAGAEGAGLVVFPETWLPGYPVWLDEAPGAALWDHPPAKALFRALRDNSPRMDGPEIRAIREAAEAAGTDVVIGVNEKDGNTLYNSMVFMTDSGRRLAVHRKLVPTYTERLVWGRGDGSGLVAVETAWGQLGGLVCWEHWMPLARAALHARGETVHVAQWPWVKEMHQVASRHYAFEGRCFVAASGSRLSRGDVLEGFDTLGPAYAAGRDLLEGIPGDSSRVLLDAGSAVIGPHGGYVAGPLHGTADTLWADIDPGRIDEELMTLDTDGHYSRPDVFTLSVNTGRQSNVEEP